MKFIWTPQKKNRDFFCKPPKRKTGNLLFVILSTATTRGFHIPASTAQQAQTRESRASCHTPKDSFFSKKRQHDRRAPPPLAKNRWTVSRKAFRTAFWHPVLVHPKCPNRDKKPVSGLLFPPYSPRKYRFYEFSHSIGWDSSSAFSQTIFISAHKNHIFCGHPAATKWKKGHFLAEIHPICSFL